MEDRTFKAKLVRYIDAGFPIIYINTFEEDKVDSLIPEISSGKEVYEWNETNGYIDFETKTPLQEDCTLERMLDQLKTPDLLDRKILIFKWILHHIWMNQGLCQKVKGWQRMINQGVDATDYHSFVCFGNSKRHRKVCHYFRNGLSQYG